jgi:hypothetical protein
MVFLRELAIRRLDLRGRGSAGHAQDGVKVAKDGGGGGRRGSGIIGGGVMQRGSRCRV